MDSYVNIKAIQSAKLTLKGYSETDTGPGLAWSCKVYLQNKKIGLVKDPGGWWYYHNRRSDRYTDLYCYSSKALCVCAQIKICRTFRGITQSKCLVCYCRRSNG
ncbi:hypothetical protein PL963_P100063 (plasmid) [Pseudomonas cerasi]|uniref:Uncharacterized protein n=1 Tax=Pseudomonas cerasi TaxID=1583341 RepID=A0A2K4W2D1_9PSED|nr:hypothetical protein PL963_P100063 [Pseudomonas cerasi]